MTEDLLVALVALVVGTLALATALGNWQQGFSLPKAAWLESRLGRLGVRVLYALIGFVLLTIAVLLACGLQPYKMWD